MEHLQSCLAQCLGVPDSPIRSDVWVSPIRFAGWVNRQQQLAIENLLTENRVLKEKLGKKRILLSDDQRRRLAVKGKRLGCRALSERK